MSLERIAQASPADFLYDVRHQLREHLYGRARAAFEAGDRTRDALDVSALPAYQKALREAFIASLGGLPEAQGAPGARHTGTVRCERFDIEKWILEVRDRVYVTANLYVPHGLTGRNAAVLFVCGHHDQAKHVPEYQTVCRHLALAGLIVLAIDPPGQGERYSYYEPALAGCTVECGTSEHDYAGFQCWLAGDSIARYFVHDAMRALDFLFEHPLVDAARVGVTGNSGGGTQTSLLMLCEPRLAAAAPATFIMSRESYMYAGGAQDCEQVWPGFSELGYDHEDILLAFAPKPVRVLAVTSDFFPIEGTRDTVRRASRVWSACGAADALDLVEDNCTHEYTNLLARSAAAFFSRHLMNRDYTPPADADIAPMEPSLLWCTRSGQVRGELPGARGAFEQNFERVQQAQTRRYALGDVQRRAQARDWLCERVYAHRQPCAFNARFMFRARAYELESEHYMWWSQAGILNYGVLLRDFAHRGKTLPLTLAVFPNGTRDIAPRFAQIRALCASGRAVLVVDVTGAGNIEPHPLSARGVHGIYGAMFKFACDLVFLGDSLPALRTYDVLRALEFARTLPGLDAARPELWACGKQGVYALLASLLTPIEALRCEDIYHAGTQATSRHYDYENVWQVALPGMLQWMDTGDLLRWAERKD